ncbi:methyltransferase domain-containing protein [Alicyclobacillaceae bacterium I2511]|nr:methyltransferase domain-containing protein [Alicyclobacillaceae bacterium I2511]
MSLLLAGQLQWVARSALPFLASCLLPIWCYDRTRFLILVLRMKRMHERENLLYQSEGLVHPIVEVIQRRDVRYLRFGSGGGWQGAMRTDGLGRPVFAYQRAFLTLLESMAAEIIQPESFLSMGVGTGTALRNLSQLFPECHLNGVELDKKVLDIALKYFDCPSPPQAEFWVGDGIEYLSTQERVFDLIFVDAYLKNRVYSPCVQPQFVQLLASRLKTDGIAVLNLITGVPPKGGMGKFLNAAKEQFASVLLLPVSTSPAVMEQNVLGVFTNRTDIIQLWTQQMRHSLNLSFWQRTWWPYRLVNFE